LSLVSPWHKLAGFQEENQFKALRRLHQTPEISQRILTKDLGISLGSINFRFQSLVGVGVVQKSKLTTEFLRRKVVKYEALQVEIEKLKSELSVDLCKAEGLRGR
jgi:hypothetical protein